MNVSFIVKVTLVLYQSVCEMLLLLLVIPNISCQHSEHNGASCPNLEQTVLEKLCLIRVMPFVGSSGWILWWGWHSLVGKDIELDAVSSQFEPHLSLDCVCTATPQWCGLRY